MYNKEQICDKIREIYPDIGACGIDVALDFDRENHAWTVDLKRGNRKLKTFVEPEDAENCLEGRQCFGLGFQIAQLKDNIQHM